MSTFYKYNFISPEGVFATIQEELKAYFDTGACDNLLFPLYLNKCLNKLGKSSYSITNDILYIEDFQARLPDNFYAVREAWLCTEIPMHPYQTANSFYSQAASATTIQIAPMIVNGHSCNNPECNNGCAECMPTIVQAVYKTNNEVARSYTRHYLLKPGNISVRQQCDVEYIDDWQRFSQNVPFSSNYESFDIRDNKFVVNFRSGIVNLVFYATDYDENQNQLMPDNYRIKEYVEHFIKYKMFETLTNQSNDETFNQLQQKMMYYKQLSDEAYIMAELEIKKQTIWQKQRAIKSSLSRHRRYELPEGRVNKWHRNN